MEKQTKIVGIANMKGGTGKTTTAALLAGSIHNRNLGTVIGIDLDDLQKTWYNHRIKEREFYASVGHEIKEEDLYAITIAEAGESFADFLTNHIYGQYDYVICDMPGSLKQEGVISSLIVFDLIISPFKISDKDIDSTEFFMKVIKDKIQPARKELGLPDIKVYGMMNEIVENSKEFKEITNGGKEALEERLGYPILENFIPRSDVAFKREASTINDYKIKKFGSFEALTDEIINILN